LREFERWVVPWGDVLHVDGHVEGEREEGDYYEVWYDILLALYILIEIEEEEGKEGGRERTDKSNGYCRNSSVRIKRSEVVL